MLAFEPTDTQRMLVDLARDFTNREIIPRTAFYDKSPAFPQKIFNKAHQAGLLNISVPEKWGGAGLGSLEFILATEQMAYGCVGIAGALSLNTMIADALLLGASDKQKEQHLKSLTEGAVASYAMTDPGTGSDVAALKTQAHKKGRKYILKGSKTWISNASQAEFFIVFAKTDPEAGHKGLSAFLVDAKTPGVEVGKNLEKMGQKAAPACEVFFNNAEVSEDNLLGQKNEGFVLAMQVFDRSRPMIAALGVGLAQRALDEAVQYARNRQTMNRPIIQHQAIGHKLTDMAIGIESSRLLTYKASYLLDNNHKNTRWASMAKAKASDMAVHSANEGLQVFGGMGYSPEYPMEKLYRDAKVLQIYEGTNEIQRSIIARELEKTDAL